MMRRGHVPHEPDVGRPREILRILSASDDEALVGQGQRGLEKELLQHVLAIARVRPEIRQIRAEIRYGLDTFMDRRIRASVKRRDRTRGESRLELVECTPTGI